MGIISIEEIYKYWKELLKYIENYCLDEEYRYKFYIQVQYYLSDITYKDMKYIESAYYFQNGIKELQQRKSVFYLDKFLYLFKRFKNMDNLKYGYRNPTGFRRWVKVA